MVRPSSNPRHRAGTRTANQYAKGKAISRQSVVPISEIRSVPLKTLRNVPENESV
jgi:hypothetical protein